MRKLPRWSMALLCFALLAVSLPAATAPRIVESLTPQQFVKYLDECDLPDAKIDKDGDVIVNIHKMNVLVLVATTKHTLVKFKYSQARTKANLRTVNGWNKDRSFTKAFLDEDGDPVLELDLDLEGGVTEARVRDAIKTYVQSLAEFIAVLKELE